MNSILFGLIFALTQMSRHSKTSFETIIDFSGLMVDASPVPPNAPYISPINPYIRHWEAAYFDKEPISRAHYQHKSRRRKRYATNTTNSKNDTSQANTIKLQFFAHNRHFRVSLREDPDSIFSRNVEFENTLGPIRYDVSRVYTGTLEDHDDSIVHGILTEDGLFDGSILTPSESYYIEPASKYSDELHKNGVHTIVYKTSDVHMLPHRSHSSHESRREHCASQRLYEKMKKCKQKHFDKNVPFRMDEKASRLNSVSDESLSRNKRWLADELIESRDPPLPLDLDAPYNDDYSAFSRKYNKDMIHKAKTDEPWKSILITGYNSKNEYILRNLSKLTHANNNLNDTHFMDEMRHSKNLSRILNANYSKPSHKTHVEIITKNGATKKPHIIGGNYNPDVILTRNNFLHHQHHNNNNNNINTNIQMNSIDAKSLYDRKSTCMLYLQADHTFFEKMGSEEASIEAITRHVQRANSIYKNTDFNGDGKPDNITFMIKRIKIHTSNALKDTSYRFPGNYGVEKFLELFSEEDYDAFCLAYMFTYRDFEMGTLGLAWTGDLKNAGGVCEKNGHYRGSLKSLNTGIVTLLNYGKHVPPAVSHVTLAHEIGHNFGSPHDPDKCSPGGEDGNFIMFARATSGDKKNNNKFSPCSLRAIEPVLNSKARSSKGCFTEPQQAICGNGVVDPGEQCDCGWEEDCKDACCYPMTTNPSIDEKPCTLTPKSHCSPSQGPCCTTACALKFGDKCRDDNGCRDQSFCNGHTAQCPPSINKPNKTVCNKEFVCYMGECTGSICLAYGLESCQCIPTADDPKTKACELCCKLPGEGSPCRSSFVWNDKPYDVPDMYSKPGTPCNDYNGYCDVFQKCREVDPAGPLATLRRLLLSEEAFESFRNWVSSNWFAVLLILCGLISIMILSVKLFGKEIARKSKLVTIIHSATTETVRLPENSNGVIVHAAIRTKVPLKKKVRGERKGKSKRASGSKATKTDSPTKIGDQLAGISNSSKNKVFKNSLVKSKKSMDRKSIETMHLETQAAKNPTVAKSSKTKSSKVPKEVINYAKRSMADNNKAEAFGKVQQWLLDTSTTQPQPSSSLQKSDNSDKARQINKSQSHTQNLDVGQRAPKKTKSLSNLHDKVKLQVVYKPPFNLKLKFSSNPLVKTRIVHSNGVGANRNRRHQHHDKSKRLSIPNEKKKPRTAVLLRSRHDHDMVDGDHDLKFSSHPQRPDDRQQLMPSERKHDTLDSKTDSMATHSNGSKSIETKNPMNDALKQSVNMVNKLINTDTFRVSKTSSATNLIANYALDDLDNNLPDNPMIMKSASGHRSSFINNSIVDGNPKWQHEQNNILDMNRCSLKRASTSNLSKHLVPKITRSSTTNLSKPHSNRNSLHSKDAFFDINRSNSTDFSKPSRYSCDVEGSTKRKSNKDDKVNEAIGAIQLPQTQQQQQQQQSSHIRNPRNPNSSSLATSAGSSTSSTQPNTK